MATFEDMLDAQRRRVFKDGQNLSDGIRASTKRQQVKHLLESPSLQYIKVGDNEDDVPCIVSNEQTFLERRFLFLPDTDIRNGEYIHHQGFIYLVTDVTLDDIYPQAFGTICPEIFKVQIGTEKRQTGVDNYGRPEYEEVPIYLEKPCTYTTKAYSTAENAAVPLPDGVADLQIPYSEDYKVLPNYTTEYHGEKFTVTTVSYEHVIQKVGYIKIRLQRVVE